MKPAPSALLPLRLVNVLIIGLGLLSSTAGWSQTKPNQVLGLSYLQVPIGTSATICGGGQVVLNAVPDPADGFVSTEIDWYDAPTGGNLILSNSTTLTVTVSSTTYYYAQARNDAYNRISLSRCAVAAIVNPNPTLTSISMAPPTICAGGTSTITLNGLIPNSTSTVYYSINGMVPTPAAVTGVTANASGVATFTSTPISQLYNDSLLTITAITRTDLSGACTQAFNISGTISVKPYIECPGERIIYLSGSTCSATNVNLRIPQQQGNCAFNNVSMTYFNGTSTITRNNVTGDSVYTLTFPLGTTFVTWTAQNNQGQTSTCVQPIRVIKGIVIASFGFNTVPVVKYEDASVTKPIAPSYTASGVSGGLSLLPTTSFLYKNAEIKGTTYTKTGGGVVPGALSFYKNNYLTANSLYCSLKPGQGTNDYFQIVLGGVSSFKDYSMYFQYYKENSSDFATVYVYYKTAYNQGWTHGLTFSLSDPSVNNRWMEQLVNMNSITGINDKDSIYLKLAFDSTYNGNPIVNFDNIQFLAMANPPVLGTYTSTEITCASSTATISVTNYLSGWEYSVNGGTSWQDSKNFTGLTAGTYNVQMREKAQPTGCVYSINQQLVVSPLVAKGPRGYWIGTSGSDFLGTDWFYNCNWADYTVPDNTVDVVIPNDAKRICVIDPNTSLYAYLYGDTAKSRHITINKELQFSAASPKTALLTVHGNLTISPMAGHVNMQSGGKIDLAGNWTNNRGTSYFTEGIGTVQMMGGPAYAATLGAGYVQYISSVDAKEGFYNLTINNLSNLDNGVTVYRNSQLANFAATVSNLFKLVEGRVYTKQNALLSILNNNTTGVEGGKETSYVNGPMNWYTIGTGDFNFPVGKPNGPYRKYRPAKVAPQPEDGSVTVYNVEYFAPTGSDINPMKNHSRTFMGILNTEYWQIDRTSGAANAIVKLEYISPTTANNGHWTSVAPDYYSNVAITKAFEQSADTWYFTNYLNTSSGFNMTLPETRNNRDTGWLWSKLITSFSPFTFGFDLPAVLGHPSIFKIVAFEANMSGQQDAMISWKVENVSQVKMMELQYSADGIQFNKLSNTWPGNTQLYSYLHSNIGPAAVYYRLVAYGLNGEIYYSPKIKVEPAVDLKSIIHGIVANPVQGQAVVSITSANQQQVLYRIIDIAGSVKYQGQLNLQVGRNMVPIAVASLPNGIYELQLATQDAVKKTVKMLKQ